MAWDDSDETFMKGGEVNSLAHVFHWEVPQKQKVIILFFGAVKNHIGLIKMVKWMVANRPQITWDEEFFERGYFLIWL